MNSTLADLLRAGPVVLDGAWGTQLQQKGLAPGECPDGWNLTHPDRVREVAMAYVEAGSRVILTNTFGANRIALSRHNLVADSATINKAGAAISLQAAKGKALVFGSMGPCGRLLLSGDVTEQEIEGAFGEQARALKEAGVHGIVVETMSDLAEAEIAVGAAHETGLPVVACMSFDSGQASDRTMMGVTPEQAADELRKAGADAVGANCGLGIEGYLPLCVRLRAATNLPLWIKPNAGTPELVDGAVTYRTGVMEFVERSGRLLDAGANFIGGCCGTTPAFISALADLVKQRAA